MSIYNAIRNGKNLGRDFSASGHLVRHERIQGMYISVGGKTLEPHEKELLAKRIAASLNETADIPLLGLEA